jgi:hypothetical protein
MAYQEEEQVRLRRQRSKQAIALAMQGRWREAVAANQEIIASFPNDFDAYNRLGRAYIELGEYSLAKEAYERAVELDPYNIIAQKNLQRLSYLGEAVTSSEADSDKVEPQHFIEETGKTGVVDLYQLAPRETLAKMVAGDKVYLRVNGPGLTVENAHGEYIGQVEPRHGQRLIKLMNGGNQYTAAIVSATEDRVTVIIREVYQDPSQAGQLSFPPKRAEGLRPYLSDKMLRRELEYMEALADESADAEDKNIDNQD